MARSSFRVGLIALFAAAALLFTFAAPVARATVVSPWDTMKDHAFLDNLANGARASFALSAEERRNTLKVMQAFAAALPSLGWTGDDFCTWNGVSCFDSNVTFVAAGTAAAGTLPEMPDDVDYSKVKIDQIDIFNMKTEVTGTLPSSWGKLSEVRLINLAYTSISGTLPASWASMSSLKSLALSSTGISGTLPAAWGSMPALEVLTLSTTQITGTLPEEWSTMPSVQRIHIQRGKLYGPFPASWAQMPSLERLALQTNDFCGCLPASWLSSTTLLVGVDSRHRKADCATASPCPETTTTTTMEPTTTTTTTMEPTTTTTTTTTMEPTTTTTTTTTMEPAPTTTTTMEPTTTTTTTTTMEPTTTTMEPAPSTTTTTTMEPTTTTTTTTTMEPASSSSSPATTARPTSSPSDCYVPNCVSCDPNNSIRCNTCCKGYTLTAIGVCIKRGCADAAALPVGTVGAALVSATVAMLSAMLV